MIAIPATVIYELLWVLRRVYGFAPSHCVTSIEALMISSGVAVKLRPVRAGQRLLSAVGDFADGVTAYGGRALGGEQLVTFDKEAARLLSAAGEPVLLL